MKKRWKCYCFIMPTTPAFNAAYAALNSRQKEAVDAIEGPVMVIAGPGTGKTNILTLRIANILARTDTEPEAILALTYTTNAAAEMQSRLVSLIGPAAWRVTLTTFHGLCEQIIHDHEERFTDLAGRRVADDVDRRRIMERLFTDADYLDKLAGFGDDPYYITPALRAIEELKREGAGPERLGELVAAEQTTLTNDPALISTRGPTKGQLKAEARLQLERMDRLNELVPLYRAYETALAKEQLYDYTDMLTRVRDALVTDELLRLALQERFQYLLVDEHQDTNAVQNQIVELLAGFFDQPNLFIVGDEKQAIYCFQGASLDNFLYFRDRFKKVRLIALTENYRSSQLILDAAQGIRASREPLQAQQTHTPSPILLCSAPSVDAQYRDVGRRIQECLQRGDRPDQIAVLYRRNADGQELASTLAHMGIPYALDAQADVLDDSDIARLLLILEAVHDYGQPGPLYEALHVPWLKIPPLDIYKLSEFSGRDRNPYDVIASMSLMADAHLAELNLLLQWSRRMAGWHTLARQEDVSRTLETIVQESGCLSALIAHPQGSQKLSRLHALYDIARTLTRTNRRATLIDLVDHLRYIRDKGIRLHIRTPTLPGRVRLMTAHGAKGLEFDTVFLVNCYEKHWPSPHRSSPLVLPASIYVLRPMPNVSEESDAEERNLFFVALTRARHQAVISWPRYDRQGKELAPSRYIDLIPPALIHQENAPLIEIESAHLAPAPSTGPDLADREYLRERFIQQGFSATALNNYLTCPWQYFYRTLVRIPEAPNVHLMYGNAVDRALEQFFERRMIGESVDKKVLLTYFNQTVQQQPFPEHDLRTALERGRRALDGWYEKWHPTWPTHSRHQVRITGIPVPGLEITLTGKLDKLELLTDSDVRVVDYKTGRPKPKDENYRRQLTFYRTLLDRQGTYHLTEAVLDFIDPDLKGNYRRESFVITKEEGDQLMDQIVIVCQEILDLAFWNRTCGDTECRYCALRQMMK